MSYYRLLSHTCTFCHIITWVAFGDRVPEWFHSSNPNSFECSHLCEAFWHEFLAVHSSVNDLVLPFIHCVNLIKIFQSVYHTVYFDLFKFLGL